MFSRLPVLAVEATQPWYMMLLLIVAGVALFRTRHSRQRRTTEQWSRVMGERRAKTAATPMSPFMAFFGGLLIALGLFGLVLSITGPIGD